MDQKQSMEGSEQKNDTCRIDVLLRQVREFDPGKTAGSWSPREGGEIIVALNKLHDSLIKKAAEIKQYVRTLTVEELNDLDGFDRCTVGQPALANTPEVNATPPIPNSSNATSST